MAAKEMKKLTAASELTSEITAAIQKAHEAGLSADDVRASLERIVSLLDEE
jgi:hypothetical protein